MWMPRVLAAPSPNTLGPPALPPAAGGGSVWRFPAWRGRRFPVMARLDRAILRGTASGSDGPVKPGHDGKGPGHDGKGPGHDGENSKPAHDPAAPLLAVLLLALPLLTGCAPGRDLPVLPAQAEREYRLGPGDSVRIITYGEDPLTGEFRIDDRGRIALPLAGSVEAGGKTPRELQEAVAEALKKGDMLKKPSVSVEVSAYRPVYVLGEVNKPGQYPWQPGMRVVTAAAVAGGFTYRAVEAYAGVVRTVDGEPVEGRASRQASIRPGDVITVYERRF